MKIEHEPKAQRFFARLGAYEASLLYAKRGRVLDFYHLYVPDPYRKQGVAAKILIHAFEYAKKEGHEVVPSCPFIAGEFLPRFPEYQKLVRAGEFPFASEAENGKKKPEP